MAFSFLFLPRILSYGFYGSWILEWLTSWFWSEVSLEIVRKIFVWACSNPKAWLGLENPLPGSLSWLLAGGLGFLHRGVFHKVAWVPSMKWDLAFSHCDWSQREGEWARWKSQCVLWSILKSTPLLLLFFSSLEVSHEVQLTLRGREMSFPHLKGEV